MVSTGTGECRTTFSATLPISRGERPVRPSVDITMLSADFAASMMRVTGSPRSTWNRAGGLRDHEARGGPRRRALTSIVVRDLPITLDKLQR